MGSRRQQPLNLRQDEGRLLHAALVEQEEDEDDEEGSEESSSDSTSRAEPVTMPTFDVPYFRYIDDEGTEGEEEWSSSRSMSSMEEDSSTDSVVSDRYMVVSGTPEKILEHLLNELTLDDDRGTAQGKEPGQHVTLNSFVILTSFNQKHFFLCALKSKNYNKVYSYRSADVFLRLWKTEG